MATGGMGDVLSGMIGGMLCQKYTPWEAACLGTFYHGKAGDELAKTRPFGYSASDVAHILPYVLTAAK